MLVERSNFTVSRMGRLLGVSRSGFYASAQITAFAAANGLTRSMGYTGICWDNSMAESFFATLKTEFYYRRVWSTKKAARIEVGRGSRTGTTVVVGTPRSVRSPPWPSNCNTHARSRTLNKPHNPCPRNGGRANGPIGHSWVRTQR